MYPRLTINLQKLKNNLDAVAEITKKQGGCSLMIVTKALCADPEMIELVSRHPAVDFMADSRTQNLKTYAGKERKRGKQTVLLRIPMECELKETVAFADISFNSEPETLKLLNEEAGRQEKTHKVVLMIDLGDLREGIFYQNETEIFAAAELVLKLEHLELYGIAVNLTCYGAIIPKHDNLSLLCQWAEKIENKFGIRLQMISGGNSSSIYLIESIAHVRNICAHYGRLYNAKLTKTPALYKEYKKRGIHNYHVFAVLLCMKELLPNDYRWEIFVDSLDQLLKAHPAVKKDTMGFPDCWQKLLIASSR